MRQDFVSEDEEAAILKELSGESFERFGFHQMRRIIRYSFDDNDDQEQQGTTATAATDAATGSSTTRTGSTKGPTTSVASRTTSAATTGRQIELQDGGTRAKATAAAPKPVPAGLRRLRDRLELMTGRRASRMTVEEHGVAVWTWASEYDSTSMTTTFESGPLCICRTLSTSSSSTESPCTCFVAHIPLRQAAIQHFDKPIKRQVSCWELESPNHWIDVHMERRSILLKTDQALWQWRTQLTACPRGSDQVFILKFYALNTLDGSNTTSGTGSITTGGSGNNSRSSSRSTSVSPVIANGASPHPNGHFGVRHTDMSTGAPYQLEDTRVVASTTNQLNDHCTQVVDDGFGYIPSNKDRQPLPDEPMPPMQDLLTIIITTSPIKSNPSTEVIEKAMETFVFGGTDFAYQCRKVIVCDGYRTKDAQDASVSRRHANAKQAMRNGIVTLDQAEHYKKYKRNLQNLCETANEQSPFWNAVVVELQERMGYGFALRHALRHCVQTPFVCVIQHDRTFMRPTPIRETLEAMWRHPRIKYVGMNMKSNLMYRDIFLTKYGRTCTEELRDGILRVPELLTDATRYGPNSLSTEGITFNRRKISDNVKSLIENYWLSSHYAMEQEWRERNPIPVGKTQMSLTPTLFWYDNVHICETQHYRDFVFHRPFKMVARGGFVEDKLSPVLKRTVDRLGFREGHARFGCYLLDDHSGMYFTGHLDGGPISHPKHDGYY